MPLYQIRYDGPDQFVEAADFSEAISLWKRDIDDAEVFTLAGSPIPEPKSVHLISDERVIRDAPKPGPHPFDAGVDRLGIAIRAFDAKEPGATIENIVNVARDITCPF